ncbi:hypothetical protein [Bacteroides sp. 224]|uniref:hypothetical protein n=1 Tax=Bacteroides sp. 224 TaxID=2302936 RepID=UPI0013D03013|nr:hypothetical protein [Bacteroides sp. 224]NDV64331.1 hypothetical protein [Bacteroides sp. 224]
MEKQIKQTINGLKIQYVLFWILPILLIIAGESNWMPVGLYADDAGMQYIWDTVGILVTIAFVPLSLKLFSLVLKKQIDTLTFPVALKRYSLWSGIRLGLLEFVVILNIVIYYLTLGNIGSLCALIALTASFFCMPSEKRLREELHIIADQP